MSHHFDDRRPPITRQLAVRVAVLGGVAFGLFAIVFLRHWFLQVLSGDDYVSQARVQIVPSSVPDSVLGQADVFRRARGDAEKARLAAAGRLRSLERDIVERPGSPTREQRRERRRLTRAARHAESVDLPAPPADADADAARQLYRKLGRVIDMRPRAIHERVVEGVAETPYSTITIKTAVRRTGFNFIRERRQAFLGTEVEKLYLRDDPHKTLAAQLFGTTREISPSELRRKRYRGVEPGTRTGADGIEEASDECLRGRLIPELRRRRLREADLGGAVRPPVVGGERRAALQPGDRRDVSDRSTFKPITAMAALEEGVITPTTTIRRRRDLRARGPRLQEREGRRLPTSPGTPPTSITRPVRSSS